MKNLIMAITTLMLSGVALAENSQEIVKRANQPGNKAAHQGEKGRLSGL